jgi:microcin C transport system substrate-binding protein
MKRRSQPLIFQPLTSDSPSKVRSFSRTPFMGAAQSRRAGLVGLLGLCLAAFQVGCQKKEAAGNTGSHAAVVDKPVVVDTVGDLDPIANAKAVKGGTYNTWGSGFPKTLNYWLNPTSFSNEVAGLLFECLVTLHSTENREAGILADSWSISPDKKTFTFHIDSRARWSDGQPIHADDVQFFYDVMMDPKNLTSPFRVGLKRFDRPVVKDSLTLVVTAKEVHWNNFWDLAGMMAFPKHVWEHEDFNKLNFDFPVVSGPYRISEVKKERSLTLERRGDWWGRSKRYNLNKYNFDFIKYRFMEDQNKTLESFKKGDIDAYPIYTASLWATQTDFDQIKKGWVAKERIFNKEPIGFQGIAMNLRRPLFQDARVREALGLLINRPLLNEKLMFNEYFLLNSYYPDLFPNNLNPAFPLKPYDPKKARALLTEAGWKPGADGVLVKGGQRFEISIPTENPDMRHLNVYVEGLKEVGILAKIEQISRSTLSKRMEKFEFDMHWVNWGGSRLRDPEPLYSSTTADEVSSNNYPGVKDKYIDSLIDAQKTEMDLNKRNAILTLIDNRLNQINPYVLLWQADHNRILYWNRFGTPAYVYDKFDREDCITTYWFVDPDKDKALQDAMKSGATLSAPSGDVRYAE